MNIGKLFCFVCIALTLCMGLAVASIPYTIENNTVFVDDANVYLSATPHTLSSSGWVYFNLTSKAYSGNIDAAWGFDTSVSKPTRAELHSPHWVNTTSNHEHTFYNITWYVYTGSELNYGNVYNTNYSYTVEHEVLTYNESTMKPDGSQWIFSNIAFDSFLKLDDTTYTIYWHDRHDKYVMWKDFTHTFNSVNHDYEGYDKWYYIKNIPVTSGQNYGMRAWVEVPVSLEQISGKYYFAVKPSFETIPQAIANGHFYALDPWWNSSWDYYKTITINQTMVSQSIGDGIFPMYINITDSDLASKAQADGDDIVFTNTDNDTQLAHQIVGTFNSTTGHLQAYINVTDISNVTYINMYYGNAGATNTENPSGVWGINASGIWLMDEGTGLYANDSSGNGNRGTLVNGVAWGPSKHGGGLEFDGVDDYVDLGIQPEFRFSTSDSFTIMGWAKLSSTATGSHSIISSYPGDSSPPEFLALSLTTDNYAQFIFRDVYSHLVSVIGTTAYNDDAWHFIAGVRDVSTNKVYLYVDGIYINEASDTTTQDTGADESRPTYIGANLGDVSPFCETVMDGSIDDVRIYNRVLSADEVVTQYNNINSPELFISVGVEQSESAAGAAPYITDWNNSKTNNNSLEITIDVDETVNFNATANQTITTWNWYKDSADQSHNFDNITLSWSSDGLKHIIVNATNTNGTSNSVTWNVTVQDTTPPASITSLTNTTGNFWHNWTWNNPTDADFNHTMIYLNNVFTTNVSNTTTFYNYTASAHNTSTISTHTVDTTGNINSTWVNHTSTIGNNPITITNTSDWSNSEGENVYVDYNHTDADGDTPTFTCNRTDLFTDFNTANCTGNWQTDFTDDGTYYVDFGVADGYGSTSNYTMNITVSDYTGTGTLYVNETGWYRAGVGPFYNSNTPIQHAIDNASSYDTVYVWNGSYTENIDITTNNLSIEGESRDLVTVTAATTADHTFYITSDYVNISGLNITVASVTFSGAIKIWNSDNCNFFSNIFHDSNYGIRIGQSHNNSIFDNIVTANIYGMYLDASNSNDVFNNTADFNTIGFNLVTSTNNLVTNNNMNSNQYGAYFSNSDNNILTYNNIISNEYGIYLYNYNDENNFISNTIDSNDYSISAFNSNDNIFTNNNITNTTNEQDYRFKTSSSNNIIKDNYNRSNSFFVESTSQTLLFQNSTTSINYTYGLSVDSIFIDNINEPNEFGNVTVESGTMDWWNITSGLVSTTSYDLRYQNGTIIGSQTAVDNSANFTTDIGIGTYKIVESVLEYTPPNPTSLTNSTGNFFVHHSWSAGTGNVTDSYNISINDTWYNGTTDSYYNNTGLSPHGYSEIITYAFNSSGSGTLSAGYVTDNVTIPNNQITISNISATYNIDEGDTLYIDAEYTDADGDTPTFTCNRTDLFTDFNTANCTGNWQTDFTDAGTYYVDFGVADGYGSTSNYTMNITVSDYGTPSVPTGLTNTTGNFWIKHDWVSGENTDTFNVSQNNSWTNDSALTYFNASVGAHGWSNITIYGYNTTSDQLSSSVSQNTQVPNNAPVLTGVPDSNTNEDIPINGAFDLDAYFSDVDGDSPSYSVHSNNQTGNVTPSIDGSNVVSYSLAANWYGVAEIVYKVEDGYGANDTDTVIVTVNSVNDPPVLQGIGPWNINEGQTVTIEVAGTDVETPDVDLDFTCNRTDLFTDFSISGGWTEWGTNFSQAGVYHVLFTVSDGTDSDSEVVTITVSNIPLTINSYWNNQTGSSLSLSVDTGTSVAFGATTNRTANSTWYLNGTSMETDANTTQANFSTVFNVEGTHYVNVSATDGIDQTANTTFVIEVSSPAAEYSISGYVFDMNATVISGAIISNNQTTGTNVTNASGYYVLSLSNGSVLITATATGYITNTTTTNVAGANVENVNVTLVARPTEDNTMPLPLFITWSLILFVLMWVSYPRRDEDDDADIGTKNLTTSFISVILAFTLAKISINGQLVQTFAGVSSMDTIVTGTQVIQISWLGWLYTFIGLSMAILTIMMLITMYKNTYGEVIE